MVVSLLLLTGVRNMVNPGIVSGTGTSGSNLENTGGYSKNEGCQIATLGSPHSPTTQSSLEEEASPNLILTTTP